MTDFQDEAAIGDGLLSPFEIGVEVALLANIGASVVITIVVDVSVPVGLATLALKLDDIVIEVDGMQIDISTGRPHAVEGAIVGLQRSLVAHGASSHHDVLSNIIIDSTNPAKF